MTEALESERVVRLVIASNQSHVGYSEYNNDIMKETCLTRCRLRDVLYVS